MLDEPGFGRDAQFDDPSLPLLHQVVYSSRAVAGVDDAEVARIVETAQRHNAAHGITGLLVFEAGVFLQWIEGPRSAIESLMANIRRDPRHHDIVTLTETEEVRERLYPDWAMEPVDAADIVEVLRDALDSAEDTRNFEAIMRILAQLEEGLLQPLGRD